MNRQPFFSLAPRFRRCAASALLSAMASAACVNAAADGFPAPTGIGATVASGDQTTLYGIQTYWDSVCACEPLVKYDLSVRTYGQISYWEGTERPSDHPSLWEGSVTPTLVWTGPSLGAATLFTELGVGISGITRVRLNTDRQFATAFQFNEHYGVGLAFGEKRKYEVAAYARHVSNGSIKQQNDGDTFFGGVFRVKFD
jgi:Lipid A 3-O-deacylase (PagL)